MRQIKFRAWHKENKIMLGHRMACATPYFTRSWAYKKSEIELMQCTDSKDKNGSEVYEGDLIKKDDDKFLRIGVVSLINGCWMVASEDGDSYFNLHHYSDQSEVIGNIHQNPELLEQNDE